MHIQGMVCCTVWFKPRDDLDGNSHLVPKTWLGFESGFTITTVRYVDKSLGFLKLIFHVCKMEIVVICSSYL